MKPMNALMKARWHQTHGAAKATLGKISKRNRTRLEGQMEQLSGRSQEKLLLTEAQARVGSSTLQSNGDSRISSN